MDVFSSADGVFNFLVKLMSALSSSLYSAYSALECSHRRFSNIGTILHPYEIFLLVLVTSAVLLLNFSTSASKNTVRGSHVKQPHVKNLSCFDFHLSACLSVS